MDAVANLKRLEHTVGVPVRYRPDVPGIAFARGLWPFKWIVVGKTWPLLPDYEREAIVAHEAGHCDRMHMEARWLLLPFCWTPWAQRIARNHEFAADAFAVNAGHGFGLLRFLERAQRTQQVANDEMAGLLCPAVAERVQRVQQLLQERHQ